jgi:cytochrome d ubiquinol oxidase subunit II
MSQSTLAALSAVLAWVALIAYAVLGGADFGGGVWDLLAGGPTAQRQRVVIARGMGPVWESNNVWLVFVLVVTWTAFPIVFAGVSTALFIPITFALIGIVLRGAAFSFRSNYGLEVGSGVRWGHVFNIASVITPFLFGTIAGALASGNIRVSAGPPLQVQANLWTTWTTPFALACGLFAVGLCAVLAATYLTVDAQNANDVEVVTEFRQRALIAGAVTAVLGAVAAVLAISEAPTLWSGLVGRALPFSLAAVVIGLATAVALLRNLDRLARVLVAGETVFIFLAWGVAQWPYLIVPDVTIDNAASPASVLGPMLIVSVVGLLVLIPSLWFLFTTTKRRPASSEGERGATTGPATSPATSATVASFVATLQPAVAATSPTDRDAVTQAEIARLEASLPGGALVKFLEPALAFMLAIGIALGVTAASDEMRRQLDRGRTELQARLRARRQARRQAGAH